MTLKGVELIQARRQIDAMIRADAVMVTFLRREKVDTGDGGWRWGELAPLPAPQQIALIPFKRRMTEFLKNTELGEVSDLPYVLLGRYNLNVRKHDRFVISGQEYEVKTIDMGEPEVKTAAQVDYYGGGPNG